MPKTELFPTTPDALAALGPTINVQVGFDPDYKPALGVYPALPQDQYPAIVDTGATESCIDVSLASALRLNPVNRLWMSGIGGAIEVNTYLVQVVVPSLSFVLYGEFAGVHLLAGGQAHLALLGREFLRHHRLVYDGRTGIVTLESD